MGLIFDGIDLKTNYNFVVTSINGRGSPPVSRTTLELPRIDGAIELNSKLQSRNLTIKGYVYGTDASAKKDSLIKLITQAYSQEKELKFPDTNRSIYVKLAGEPIDIGPVGPILNAQAYELTFNFVAQDPYFYTDEHNESGFRIVKVNAHAPTYLISPKRKFLKREASLKIEPYTIVNLLGKYGNFETEGGTPGLADGWSKFEGTPSLVSGIIGNKAQKIEHTNTSGTLQFTWLYLNLPVYEQHTYFMSVYLKKDSNDTSSYFSLRGVFYDASNTLFDATDSGNLTVTTKWQKFSHVFTVPVGTVKGRFYYPNTAVADGNIASYTVDGAMLVDLTAMGSLPYGLQQYFSPSGITKWEDLATTSNITALDGTIKSGNDWLAQLLPYVDSVSTLGWYFSS